MTIEFSASHRLGMLTPSSNTVLEPIVTSMLSDLPNVSAHFARFRVTEISLSQSALEQFSFGPMIEAAQQLADAKVQSIAWNGTSASWLGFDRDVELCSRIEKETGIRASSSVLALNELLQKSSVQRIGLVTPYTKDIQEKIISNYEASGFSIVAERHLDESENYAFAKFGESEIVDVTREVAEARPDAISILCTNFRGARIAQKLEQELGIAILDSVTTTVWKSLRLSAIDTSAIKGWGSIFEIV